MTKCRYCAEDIQDAALVCKHCGRELASAHAPIATAAPSSSDRRVGYFALFVIAGVVAIVVISRMTSTSPTPERQQSSTAARSAPRTITIASVADIDIDAGKIQKWEWTVGADRPHCHLTGRIEVTSGGNKDVQAFVMSADDYTNWANGHPAKVFFQTEKLTVIALDVTTATAGPMVLALSNTFSVLQTKRVHVENVKAACN